MTQRQLAKALSKKTGKPAYECESFIIEFLGLVSQLVVKGHKVTLSKICTIYADVVPERNYYNPKKLRMEHNERRFNLKIKSSSTLKQKVNAKKTY